MPHFTEGKYLLFRPSIGTASTATGTPYLYVEGVPTHIQIGDGWQETGASYTRTVYMFLTDKAMQYTLRKLEGLGFNGDFSNPRFGPQYNDYVPVTCKYRSYTERESGEVKTREEWDVVSKPGAEGEEKANRHQGKLTDHQLAAFTSMYRSKIGPQDSQEAPSKGMPDVPF